MLTGPLSDMTPGQWQYISVLIAEDLRNESSQTLVDMHRPIWEAIQPLCQWDWEEEDDE